MIAHRSSLPVLPNLVKILTYDTDHELSHPSNLSSSQRKSPLRSTSVSKRLKLLHAKSISSVPKTKPDDHEKSVQTPRRRKESSNDSSLMKLDLKLEQPLKNREVHSQKKHLPKLYTESMYKKYSEKMSALKEKCSVNYSNTSQEETEKKEDGRLSLRELILKTEEQLQHSYSIKYMGVKNEGIGVLSRRVPINQLESRARRSFSMGKVKDVLSMNEKISEIVNMSKKQVKEMRNSSSTFFKESGKESHVSSSRHLNSEESVVLDIDRRVEKEYRGAQSYRPCGVITEMEENKTLESSQQGEETFQQKLATEGNQFKENIFIKEGYKDIGPKGMDWTRLSTNVDYTGNNIVEDKSVGLNGEQKQGIVGDTTPSEVYTSYVVNKFVAPHRLKAVRKKSGGMLGQKGLKALQVDSDQLNREVYMTANYASFERQVASLQKLKSTMLRTRAKSNVKIEMAGNGNSGEGRQAKKDAQHKYSYAKLLSTMYILEDVEGDGGKRSLVIGGDDNDDELLEKEEEVGEVEKGESRKKEKGLMKKRRSKSYEEGVGKSAKAQWGMIRGYLKNPRKML